jgi:GTP pyrophosphokinase
VYRLFKVDQGKEDDFLEKLGYGTITLTSVSARIMEEDRRREKERQERLQNLTGFVAPLFRTARSAGSGANGASPKKGEFIVAGVHGMHCEVAQCCNPLPGDPVIGYITRGQGVKVHKRDCRNIQNAERERLIDVIYVGNSDETYPVQFIVVAAERTGLLADLTKVLADNKINIVDVSIPKRDLKHGEVKVYLKAELANAAQIAPIMNRLKQVDNVFDVSRVTNGRGR